MTNAHLSMSVATAYHQLGTLRVALLFLTTQSILSANMEKFPGNLTWWAWNRFRTLHSFLIDDECSMISSFMRIACYLKFTYLFSGKPWWWLADGGDLWEGSDCMFNRFNTTPFLHWWYSCKHVSSACVISSLVSVVDAVSLGVKFVTNLAFYVMSTTFVVRLLSTENDSHLIFL